MEPVDGFAYNLQINKAEREWNHTEQILLRPELSLSEIPFCVHAEFFISIPVKKKLTIWRIFLKY